MGSHQRYKPTEAASALQHMNEQVDELGQLSCRHFRPGCLGRLPTWLAVRSIDGWSSSEMTGLFPINPARIRKYWQRCQRMTGKSRA